MPDQNDINVILKNIFADSLCVNIICSIYERELTLLAIADLLNLDYTIIEAKLRTLLEMRLIKKVTRNSNDHFTLTNPKVCDSILMLKDALYKIFVDDN